MIIRTIVVGPLETNCYLLADDVSREALIIDPGDDASRIKRAIERDRLVPRMVLNTHGHGDHIGANDDMGVPVLIHRADASFLTDPGKNLSGWCGLPFSRHPAARLLSEGETIMVGSQSCTVLHTPGHTPGGICLVCGKIAFTGDTLFASGVGRTDLPYSDENALWRSIREVLFSLPDETVIYPGHGPSSLIGRERQILLS